jgi:hypothetical protein
MIVTSARSTLISPQKTPPNGAAQPSGRKRRGRAVAQADVHAEEDRARVELDRRLERIVENGGPAGVAAGGDTPETTPGPHRQRISGSYGRDDGLVEPKRLGYTAPLHAHSVVAGVDV